MRVLYLFVIWCVVINLYPSELGYSRLRKLNVLWWFANDEDPIERNAKRWPDKPLWLRRILWGFRNPLPNFIRYVAGLGDKRGLMGSAEVQKDHYREALGAVMDSSTLDQAKTYARGALEKRYGSVFPDPGKKVAVIPPFITFRAFGLKGYLGWSPRGALIFKLGKL